MTITGSGFTGAIDVSFGPTSAPALNVDADTQITAISPAGTGTVDVIVTTPAGTSATSPADQFTYVAATRGHRDLPDQRLRGRRGQVTITGSGFTGATDVSFGVASGASVARRQRQPDHRRPARPAPAPSTSP